MSTEFDIRANVAKTSAIPMERLRVLRSIEELRLEKIHRGIVFVFAAWSMPSIAGFRRFTKIIKPFVTDASDIVVLDTDYLTEDSARALFGVPSFTSGGWGEAVWIRGGQVVARELTHSSPETLIAKHTSSLLDEHRI